MPQSQFDFEIRRNFKMIANVSNYIISSYFMQLYLQLFLAKIEIWNHS